jgi:hypothetical protein
MENCDELSEIFANRQLEKIPPKQTWVEDIGEKCKQFQKLKIFANIT